MSGTINAAGSTGDASSSANTAAAGSTNNPWARQQNPPEAPLVTPPAARRKEVPCALYHLGENDYSYRSFVFEL